MNRVNIGDGTTERRDVLAEAIEVNQRFRDIVEQLRNILSKTREIRKELDGIISSQQQVTRAVSCINGATRKK